MATRLRGGGEDPLEYDEYGLEHEDEHLTLIELPSGGRRGASGRAVLSESSSPGGGGASALCRCTTVVFLLALAGVYHLGLQHGKNDANNGEAIGKEKRVPWREGEEVLLQFQYLHLQQLTLLMLILIVQHHLMKLVKK